MRLRARYLTLLGLALSPAVFAARDSVSDDFPIYDNGGKPDLTVDPKRFENQMQIIDREFTADDCAIVEGSVGAAGVRRLLRFDTVVLNMGDADLVVGDRSDPANPYADLFELDTCHGHYHFQGFSSYDLLTPDGELVVTGHKQGFCFEDSFKYSGNKSGGYDCSYQGISSGWGDWYYKQLGGQWIDITGVPEGDYVVRVTIDETEAFDEGEDRYPNMVQVEIHVPDPRNKVDTAD